MTYLHSAIAGAVAVAALIAYSVHRSHSTRPPIPAVAQAEDSFEEDWRDAATKAALARPMFVKLPEAKDQPIPVKSEKIVLPSVITHGVEGPPQRYSHKVSDICTRHHMRKVHYGRTWRCRPKKR